MENSILYCMWVSFDKLFTSFSKDFGKTWSKPVCDETSVSEYFLRTNIHSNVDDDLIYKDLYLFTTMNTLYIKTFIYKYKSVIFYFKAMLAIFVIDMT